MYDLRISRSRSVRTWTISSNIPCLFALSTCGPKNNNNYATIPHTSCLHNLNISIQYCTTEIAACRAETEQKLNSSFLNHFLFSFLVTQELGKNT
uniref:Putative ovule protein n=1 Tax=Solanum chacoense TaxID=4108 RepID=A0A0V0GMC5_SOLCH